MITRPAAVALLAGALLVAGCSAPATEPTVVTSAADPTATSEATSALASTPAAATTVTTTAPGAAVTASPPPATPEPSPEDGPCPYLADDAVADINGQRTGTTQVIALQPYPVCLFRRTDGEPLASVRIITADTPQSAVAAVDSWVPIDSSDPASQPPGWVGGSMVTGSGSVYAVSKGPLAIVAESNQQQSIKGRQMVIAVVANLGL